LKNVLFWVKFWQFLEKKKKEKKEKKTCAQVKKIVESNHSPSNLETAFGSAPQKKIIGKFAKICKNLQKFAKICFSLCRTSSQMASQQL
jgi:CRISPR/Cas system-associated protein Cas5 (RAMP superfamily)